jgi:hypothetical protein
VLEAPDRFEDVPILAELGHSLDAAFTRAPQMRATRWGPTPTGVRTTRSLALAVLVLVLLAATAAAATLLVLRGSVIPSPAARDVQPAMRPIAGTQQLLGLRAADPVGGAPWGIRTARSQTGLVCSSVGRVVGGRIGVIGFDGRFRDLPVGVLDSCGQEHADAAALMGARVFDAKRRADVRTVLYGVAGANLRSATALTPGARRSLRIGPGGAFLTVLAGYPEDSALRVILRFADGKRQVKDIGRDPFVQADPEHGPAWRVSGGIVESYSGLCVSFAPARYASHSPRSAPACGRTKGPRDGTQRDAYFFAIRRFSPHDHGRAGLMAWNWRDFPARTAAWGSVSPDRVRAVIVHAPGADRVTRPSLGGTFLAVFGPNIRPGQLSVELVLRTGRHLVFHSSTGLITPTRWAR